MNTLRMAGIPARRTMLGITLLELMAVVMIIGILGAIAVPTYRQYIMRAQRADGKGALLLLQTNQERFYLINRTYGTAAQLIAANLLPADSRSERGRYDIAIGVANATTFTATATPRAAADIDMTLDTQCTSFSITAQGVRTATGTTAAACW